MVCLVRKLLALALGILLVLLVASGPAAAAGQVPFSGTFVNEQVTITSDCTFPDVCATFTGAGTITHLGLATESGTVRFNAELFATTGCSPETGTDTFTAASGNQISLTFTGQVCATGPNSGQDTLTYTITGGTGRFAGATGSGAILSRFTLTSSTAGFATTSYQGTISSPGSLH